MLPKTERNSIVEIGCGIVLCNRLQAVSPCRLMFVWPQPTIYDARTCSIRNSTEF